MSPWRKVSVGIGVVLATLAVFVYWYWSRYSMKPAQEFEINRSDSPPATVLIATQGSAFKDSIVAGVVVHLQSRQVYVKVIDVAKLVAVRERDWDAIVVIHTWEMHEPQADARRFIAGVRDLHRVIVLSTSGAGTFKMEGIDAISSASERIDVPRRVAAIDARIDALLEAKSAGGGSLAQ